MQQLDSICKDDAVHISPAAVVLVNADPIDALSRLRINYALILPPLYNSNNVYIQG